MLSLSPAFLFLPHCCLAVRLHYFTLHLPANLLFPCKLPNSKAALLLPAPLSLHTNDHCLSNGNCYYLQGLFLSPPHLYWSQLITGCYVTFLSPPPSTLPAELLSDAHVHTDFTHYFECRYVDHRPNEAQGAGERLAHLHGMGPFSSCSNMTGSAGSQTGLCWLQVNCLPPIPKSSVGSFLCPVYCWLNGKMSKALLVLHFYREERGDSFFSGASCHSVFIN